MSDCNTECFPLKKNHQIIITCMCDIIKKSFKITLRVMIKSTGIGNISINIHQINLFPTGKLL